MRIHFICIIRVKGFRERDQMQLSASRAANITKMGFAGLFLRIGYALRASGQFSNSKYYMRNL